ncbi:IPT/TIG domain-containing protein [Flavobacterium agrisoli]|uniref:IPT/TIG domain-containing protein n=1 Tax=Flavobacterium agrisoli TaxID=2793066 RepID=A0A934PLF5_9FLAO|nr:IPT/TIG domain-containing protein [Flavobacterium agrisoli]MBK0369098.1 hypothetical protein [Flavobacterium agrisoli]
MKNINLYMLRSSLTSLFTLFVLLTSCSSDDGGEAYTGAPIIESVMPSGYNEDGSLKPLEPVIKVDPNNYYVIHGKGFSSVQKIYFNDYDTYFRSTFVTDTDIIVMVDENTPYADTSNQLKIVTEKGTVVYDLIVAPPAPTINWFNSINALAGEVVTVSGKYFLDPIVKVGTTDAVVISSTLTEIKFTMPTNSTNKLISVTNITGTATSKMAVGSALYDDIIQGDAGHWTWDGSAFTTDFTEDKAQGNLSIKLVFPGWGGADMKFNAKDVSMYKSFTVKVKSVSENPDAKLTFVFGGWAYQIQKAITSQWTVIEIPFSTIGNPTSFDQLTFQESGNFGGNTILLDEMGFVLK